ncbi:hypothetical protein KPK_A0021 (plasmid) [Klebsiella variicola]|uniref:Uncharacterized protein n=1 Tax=Klebsiella variicola (strain 342) TaxID=507522 RepID=B5RJU9_KLEV3|nr:hypothetical protein KPK_A0021 [Klebsiella variicola]
MPSVLELFLGPWSHLRRQRRNAAWDHGPTCTRSAGIEVNVCHRIANRSQKIGGVMLVNAVFEQL